MIEKNNNSERRLFKSDILKFFQSSEKEAQLIGIEGEKIGVQGGGGETAIYTGDQGFLAVLGKMYEELGWEISKKKGPYILQLKRGKSILDLESDGRIELAGSPHESIHDLAREFRIHQNEITEISDIFGISWLGIGYHPVSKNMDIEDLSIGRKQEMLDFFEEHKARTNNDFGLAWYKKTAGIHATMDYSSEEDFGRKARLLFKMSPILTAMFANSPFAKEENTGYTSFRSHVTLNSGIDRFDIPESLYNSKFSYQDWIDHVLSLEVLFLKKGKKWIYPNKSFADYLENGHEGVFATWDDFDMHMRSVWMNVRLRGTIELRCIDSLPPSLVPAVPALLKGIFYSAEALDYLEKKTMSWSYDEYKNLCQEAAKNGLQARIQGEKLLDIAKELLELADTSLRTNKILDIKGNDESYYLEPIKEFILVKGKSPAEWLVEEWENEWNHNFYPVFEWCKY